MSLLDSISKFMWRSRERLDSTHLDSLRRVGTSKTHKTCERCGKSKLKKTYVFERSDGTRVYLGSECAQGHRDGAVLASGFAQMPPRMSVEDFKKKFPGALLSERGAPRRGAFDRVAKELYDWNGYGIQVVIAPTLGINVLSRPDGVTIEVWDRYARKTIEFAELKYEKTPLGEIVSIDTQTIGTSSVTKIIKSWLDTFPKWDPIKEHITSQPVPAPALSPTKPKIVSGSATLKHTALTGSAILTGQSFVGRNMTGAYLKHGNYAGADFSRANLSAAKLTSADLNHAMFRGADLSDADLNYAIVTGADFHGADLDYANFAGSIATWTVFGKAIATNVNFQDADLRYANFIDVADLTGANFARANLRGATMGDWEVDPKTWLARKKP